MQAVLRPCRPTRETSQGSRGDAPGSVGDEGSGGNARASRLERGMVLPLGDHTVLPKSKRGFGLLHFRGELDDPKR
jgi:hypothetical protein